MERVAGDVRDDPPSRTSPVSALISDSTGTLRVRIWKPLPRSGFSLRCIHFGVGPIHVSSLTMVPRIVSNRARTSHGRPDAVRQVPGRPRMLAVLPLDPGHSLRSSTTHISKITSAHVRTGTLVASAQRPVRTRKLLLHDRHFHTRRSLIVPAAVRRLVPLVGGSGTRRCPDGGHRSACRSSAGPQSAGRRRPRSRSRRSARRYWSCSWGHFAGGVTLTSV